LFATVASIAEIANLPDARFFGLRGIPRRATLARKSVAEWQARWHAPGAGFESRHGVKIRARHCPV
jgi:hypothetical protein